MAWELLSRIVKLVRAFVSPPPLHLRELALSQHACPFSYTRVWLATPPNV